MEKKEVEASLRLLSLEEFERKGIKVSKNYTGFEALRAATRLAAILLDEDLKERAKDSEINNGENGALPEELLVNSYDEKKRDFSKSKSEEEELNMDPATKRKRYDETNSSKANSESKNGDNPSCSDQSPVSDLPEKFKNYIVNELGGKDIKFLIQKKLYPTDLCKINNRLSMPVKKIKEKNFLNKDEMKKMSEEEKGSMTKEEKKLLKERKKINVKVVEPSLKGLCLCEMQFTKWKIGNSYSYVLIGGWSEYSCRNKINEDDTIQVWSFRVGRRELGLALVRVEDKEEATAAAVSCGSGGHGGVGGSSSSYEDGACAS